MDVHPDTKSASLKNGGNEFYGENTKLLLLLLLL